jgi:hypothetical protein
VQNRRITYVHPWHHWHCARGLRLRKLLNLDQAHSAVSCDREAVVVTESRDFYSNRFGGLQSRESRETHKEVECSSKNQERQKCLREPPLLLSQCACLSATCPHNGTETRILPSIWACTSQRDRVAAVVVRWLVTGAVGWCSGRAQAQAEGTHTHTANLSSPSTSNGVLAVRVAHAKTYTSTTHLENCGPWRDPSGHAVDGELNEVIFSTHRSSAGCGFM